MKLAIFNYFQTGLVILCCVCITGKAGYTQVTSDDTVNTQVNQNGKIAEITGGETRGNNLFHSFQDFSVTAGNEVFFNNANNIANILSRVTGGNISNIDGLIRANGNANLFLINPAGIVFGEGTRLDIGGSFFGSTADSIVFDEGEFSATNLDEPPLLTINAPLGLNLGNEPGAISVTGNGEGARLVNSEVIDNQEALRVDSEQTFALVGGELSLEDANIKTAGGRIELGSVAAGKVNFVTTDNGLSIDYSEITNFKDISLFTSSNATTSSVDASGNGGGDIQVYGQNITLSGLSGIEANTLGTESAGSINVFANESLTISGVENERGFVSAISNRVFQNGSADGGDINIEAKNLELGDRAIITTISSGKGNAGDINIKVDESTILNGQEANSTYLAAAVFETGVGNAGNITLDTGSLSLDNDALLAAGNLSTGRGGVIKISAEDNVSLANGSRFDVRGANGGAIKIDAQNLEITSASSLFAGIAQGLGFADAQAGDIVINTTEDVTVDGVKGDKITRIGNINFGIGNVGNIKVDARNISLVNGGAISNSTTGVGNAGNITITAKENIFLDGVFQNKAVSGVQNSLILLETDTQIAEQTGVPGTTNLTAKNLRLTNGAQITSINSGVGDSGNINVNVADSIKIDGEGEIVTNNRATRLLNSQISTRVFGSKNGSAGSINISTKNLSLTNAGEVSSNSFSIGNAGDIDIIAQEINIDGQGKFLEIVDDSGQISRLANFSSITSDVLSFSQSTLVDEEIVADGDGGTISIDTDSLSITNGGDISTSISGVGNAGDIEITAQTIEIDGQGFNQRVVSNGQIFSPLGVISSISSQVIGNPDGTAISQGDGGNIKINTNSLSLTNGGSVEADVSAIGNDRSEDGSVVGNGGNIAVNARDFVLIQGTGKTTVDGETVIPSEISAVLSRNSIGNSGNVAINTAKLSVLDGARISVSTLGEGNAGNLTINASDSIKLTDDSRIVANVAPAAIGDGGEIKINTGNLTIDNSQIQSASIGAGEAGNLRIDANSINLNNDSAITATTRTGNGGNITLNVAEKIIFRDINNFISARALNDANGGNINIDTDFIIAFPQNNDILATAQQGQGGNINITAEALFGIEERSLSLFTNDISASSEFSLDGDIAIDTPDVDPASSLENLPTNIVDASRLIARNCLGGGDSQQFNEFVVTGRGGMPNNPNEALSGDATLAADWVSLPETNTTTRLSDSNNTIAIVSTTPRPIVEAKGWKVKADGTVVLVAQSNSKNNNSWLAIPWLNAASCHN